MHVKLDHQDNRRRLDYRSCKSTLTLKSAFTHTKGRKQNPASSTYKQFSLGLNLHLVAMYNLGLWGISTNNTFQFGHQVP